MISDMGTKRAADLPINVPNSTGGRCVHFGPPVRYNPAMPNLLRPLRSLAFVAAMAGLGAPVHAGTIVEYYNEALDHYFVTGYAPEVQALDGGRAQGLGTNRPHVPDFRRRDVDVRHLELRSAVSTATRRSASTRTSIPRHSWNATT